MHINEFISYFFDTTDFYFFSEVSILYKLLNFLVWIILNTFYIHFLCFKINVHLFSRNYTLQSNYFHSFYLTLNQFTDLRWIVFHIGELSSYTVIENTVKLKQKFEGKFHQNR